MTGMRGIITDVAGEYVTTGEAAAELGVTATTLREWMHKGIVTPALTTAGGQARWRMSELRQQLAEHAAKRDDE
jgi:predicted site-specific integrase-resolvase